MQVDTYSMFPKPFHRSTNPPPYIPRALQLQVVVLGEPKVACLPKHLTIIEWNDYSRPPNSCLSSILASHKIHLSICVRNPAFHETTLELPYLPHTSKPTHVFMCNSAPVSYASRVSLVMSYSFDGFVAVRFLHIVSFCIASSNSTNLFFLLLHLDHPKYNDGYTYRFPLSSPLAKETPAFDT